MLPARYLWVIAHRWAGLSIALFVAMASLTGALLAFHGELADLAAPWRVVSAPPGTPMLDPLALHALAVAATPDGVIDRVPMPEAGRALIFDVAPRPGASLDHDQLALDPYTGGILYRGTWGDISEGPDQLMAFIYRLHYELALGGPAITILGIAALLWTVDCFIGFALTLPAGRTLASWGRSWRVKWPPHGFRFPFDLHRAGGLWLWPILLVFAWSSVGMNLRSVYNPVMGAFGMVDHYGTLPDRPAPAGFQPDLPTALAQGRALAAAAAARDGATVTHEAALGWIASSSLYSLHFAASNDLPDRSGWSAVWFAPDGTVHAVRRARGDASGNGLDTWLMALHMAHVGGLAWRIAVVVVGLAAAMLSVTGILIWMRKRSARLIHGQRNPPRPKNPSNPATIANGAR